MSLLRSSPFFRLKIYTQFITVHGKQLTIYFDTQTKKWVFLQIFFCFQSFNSHITSFTIFKFPIIKRHLVKISIPYLLSQCAQTIKISPFQPVVITLLSENCYLIHQYSALLQCKISFQRCFLLERIIYSGRV